MTASQPKTAKFLHECCCAMFPGTHYLEIGVWAGDSLQSAARSVPQGSLVFGIDPLIYGVVDHRMKLYEITEHPAVTIYERMAELDPGVAARVCLVPATSEHFIGTPLYEWLRGKVGCLFIDGDHKYEHVVLDSTFIELVAPGGFVAFHDYRPELPGFAGTVRGIDETIARYGLTDRAQVESLVVCKTRNAGVQSD